MKVHRAALLGLVVFASCRIEQTPEEYIQHRVPLAAELQATREEIDDRIRSAARGLELGSRAQVMAALAPSGEFHGIGLRAGEEMASMEDFVSGLQAVAGPGGVVVEAVEVRVSTGNSVAWFLATLRVDQAGDAAEGVRLSGVYFREEGEWRLNQAHLSVPPTADPRAPAAAGTGAGDG